MHEHNLISQVPDEYWMSADWVSKLSSWCVLMGITEVPDHANTLFLEDALKTDFKGHSFAEIEVALKMAVMGEFPEPVEAYNSLNLRFLAKVMGYYRRHRQKVANNYEEIKFMLNKPAPVIPTQFELDIAILREIWDDYCRVCNDISIFPFSYKAELLQKIGQLVPEEIKAFYDNIYAQVLSRPLPMPSDERKYLMKLKDNPSLLEAHADRKSKGIVYQQYLQQLRSDKVTFEQFCDVIEAKVFQLHEVEPPSRTAPAGEDTGEEGQREA